MKLKNTKRLARLVLAVMLIWALAGCGTGKPAESTGPNAAKPSEAGNGQSQKIQVVAAENFYGEVAQTVGGDFVAVTSILNNPQQDPHDYEPTADASKAVADAQVVVYTGIGYDNWMDKLVKAESSSKTKAVIIVGSDLLGKADGDNPHVWYNPEVMPKLANKLAADFAQIDPSHAQDYQKQADAYSTSLAPLTAKVAKLRQAEPQRIDVSEPVFDYMAEALNLQVNNPKFAKAVEEGNDPAAADYAALQNDIKGKKVKLFVHNIQADNPTVGNIVQLAAASGIPVVEVTETEPAGKSYLQWMTDQLDQVGRAFGIQ
jgi:zinc/manganese transport system substrate-binding protein